MKVDQHFTPDTVADALVSRLDLRASSTVFDPTAGAGALLAAADRVMPAALRLLGTDIDEGAVRVLRRLPIVENASRCDVLDARSRSRSAVWRSLKDQHPEFIVLNPPFSFRGQVRGDFSIGPYSGRLSPALKFLAICLATFPAKTTIGAILPLGSVVSVSTEPFWRSVSRTHDLQVGEPLSNRSFPGVTASTSIVTLTPYGSAQRSPSPVGAGSSDDFPASPCVPGSCVCVEIERGRVPVGSVRDRGELGVPFVHTSNLRGHRVHISRRTDDRQRSTSGRFVAIVRVGAAGGKAAVIEGPVVLSDCLFAVRPRDVSMLPRLHKQLKTVADGPLWPGRGTGAPHATLGQIGTLLTGLGWNPVVVPASSKPGSNCREVGSGEATRAG